MMINRREPQKFAPLFLPNWTPKEAKRFTPFYKDELRKRLYRGEEVNPSDLGVKEFILKGGRLSGKTKSDEEATVPEIVSPVKGDIWYCRSEDNTIRRSIFQSMQATLHEFGLTLSNRTDTDFKVTTSPFEIKNNRTGNVIQFFAINKDINRTKGQFPPSGKLKRVMLEEANEPDGKEYVEALRSTALRFMDENSKFICRYNPPPSYTAWANQYYPGRVAKGATLIHSTWEDIADLLDPVVIAEILQMKQTDPVHYAYWYGGEVVSLEGLVIWSFDRHKHLISVNELQGRIARNIGYQPSFMFYGVDSGLKNDATAISAWGIYPDGLLIKLSTFYLDIKDFRRKTGEKGISHTDQVMLMIEWYNDFRKEMSALGIGIPDHYNERWCFDGAAITQDLMLEFEKATRWLCKPVTDKDIERDIARLVNSYRSNMLRILDTPANAISVNEMETFARDEENEIPEGQSDHTIDADKYATYEYYYNFL
jgi:PBSX family phage terminase large subunit|nr:MAG TPA: large terminase [Caudoviricetes sp.]